MDALLYTRRGCHLCEAAEDVVADLLPGTRIIDVDGEPGLAREYGTRVPVLVVAGRIVAEGRIDAETLATLVAGGFTGPD